jgi:hypothetical protein
MVHFMNFFSSRCILNYFRPVLKDKIPGKQQICKESKKTPQNMPLGLKRLKLILGGFSILANQKL